jgi:hypothetical protein
MPDRDLSSLAQRQLAAEYPDNDPDLMADATELGNRALEAIRAGNSELFHWRTLSRRRFSRGFLAFDGRSRRPGSGAMLN